MDEARLGGIRDGARKGSISHDNEEEEKMMMMMEKMI